MASPLPTMEYSTTELTTSSETENPLNKTEKGGKKGRVKGPCELLSSEPYVNIEITKFGRDPNVSYSSGKSTILLTY